MGAMQAQDYNMAKWAIGVRLPGSTDKLIEDAYNKGEILRTHVMRPTWHFVKPEDIRDMLQLSADKIKSSSRSRDRSAVLPSENHSKAVSSNGIFRPVIIVNGQVVGLWKKSANKKQAVQTDYFEPAENDSQNYIAKAMTDYLRYFFIEKR
jgi:hypothetical protein